MLARARQSFEALIVRIRREWSRDPFSTPPVALPPRPRLLRPVKRQSIDELSEVLSSGADPNERFEKGMTALMLAAGKGWADGVALLLSRGADARLRNALGYTAMGLAYWDGERTTGATADAYQKTIELLRAAGCPE